MTVLALLALLVFAHALADYPLQGDFLARAKNPTAPIPGVPWWQAMTAHAAIHGGFVMVITGSLALGAAEFMAHFVIDTMKCRGFIGYNTDQALHIACKVIWVAVVVLWSHA